MLISLNVNRRPMMQDQRLITIDSLSSAAAARIGLATADDIDNTTNDDDESTPLMEGSKAESWEALRVFTAIVCSKCHYIEFPGCDSHGLYTEMLPNGQAKCPNCAATTDKVKPFRDGCRRCKGHTKIFCWNASRKELAQAQSCFPPSTAELKHSILACEQCCSIMFPTSREKLTSRTPNCPLTGTNGRNLTISNYQLGMVHVDSCPRVGMPLQAISVLLTMSELDFLFKRMGQCPIASPFISGPTYVKRKTVSPVDDNQLHQFQLQVLLTIMKSFDSDEPGAAEAMQQVASVVSTGEPASTFDEWSPPREFPESVVQPSVVSSSAVHSDRYVAAKVLEVGSSLWRSATHALLSRSQVYFQIECESQLDLSSIVIRWAKKYMASAYTIHVSDDGTDFQEVARINEEAVTKRIVFPAGTKGKFLKIVMLASVSNDSSFGIESIKVYRRDTESVYTQASDVLQEMHLWLYDTAVSSKTTEMYGSALQALQGLTLTSGSFCALLQLILLLLADRPESSCLPEEQSAAQFVRDLTTYLSEHLFCDKRRQAASVPTTQNPSSPGMDSIDGDDSEPPPLVDIENSLFSDERFRMFRNFPVSLMSGSMGSNSNTSTLPPLSSMNVGTANVSGMSTAAGGNHRRRNNNSSSSSRMVQEISSPEKSKEEEDIKTDNANIAPFLSSMKVLSDDSLLESLRTPKQLAMILLSCLAEVSIWQMQKMQKADSLADKSNEDELYPLEEPFSIQVCADTFSVCHKMLSLVLSHHLGPEGDDDGVVNNESENERYCDELDSEAALLNKTLPEENQDRFSARSMALAILQVITAHLRRLVLSRVNPSDVGINPDASLGDNGSLTTPPELSSMLNMLERIISAGCHKSDELFPLSLQAAAAMEVGMEAIYPSSEQRTKLLTSRMGKGATLELQLRWPVAETDLEDPRYERLVLLLQLECSRMGIVHSLKGKWKFYIHLVIMIPETKDTEEMLRKNVAECIQNAGFVSWQVAAGAQEISVTLQRHLHWNRVEKMQHDSGSSWIRVYPRSVATYEEVLTEVDTFVAHEVESDDS